jgi:beta-aspartyl-peptidase (threonine type)
MTAAAADAQPAAGNRPAWRLVIHGGAGVIERDRLTAEDDRAIRAALDLALRTGAAILDRGGSALDAVEATEIGRAHV